MAMVMKRADDDNNNNRGRFLDDDDDDDTIRRGTVMIFLFSTINFIQRVKRMVDSTIPAAANNQAHTLNA